MGQEAAASSPLTELWQVVLTSMETELRRPSFDTWLKGTHPVDLLEDTLVVAVENSFAQQWIESRYLPLILEALRAAAGKQLGLRLVTPEGRRDTGTARELSPVRALPADRPGSRPPVRTGGADPVAPEHGRNGLSHEFNPKYTFETFVVGHSNRLAHAAALAVCESPGRAYNPLFVYGGAGLGKTHLMQAIGHYTLRCHPETAVLYVGSETFTNELINAIRDDRTIEFKNRYRSIDVLLIDDIQFLAGKERTQEEFFHTFEALHGSSRQIVVSSDRPPKDILPLEERLRSRFEWGLLADIQPPDLETRAAILQKKAQSDGLSVPEDVIEHVASRVSTNIRELEGALIRIVATASLENQPITLESAMKSLRDILPTKASRPATIREIQGLVAKNYSVSVEELVSESRVRRIAFPRQIAMYLCRELTHHSLPRIGQDFGGRDHTTVLHAFEKISRARHENPALDETIVSLIAALQSDTA